MDQLLQKVGTEDSRVAVGVAIAVVLGAIIYVYIFPVFNVTWAFIELLTYPLHMFIRWLATI